MSEIITRRVYLTSGKDLSNPEIHGPIGYFELLPDA